MIILEDRSKLREQLDLTKRVGFIDVCGVVHEGHAFVINKLRALVDTLIVIQVSWNRPATKFYDTGRYEKDFYDFDKVINSVKGSAEKDIDFLVHSPSTPFIEEQVRMNLLFRHRVKSFCEELGVGSFYKFVLLSTVFDDELAFLYADNSYTGPKNILIDLISRKLLRSERIYAPKYIWDMYRDPETFCLISRSIYRSTTTEILGASVKQIYDRIMGGDNQPHLRDTYPKVKTFLIDLDTLTRIDRLSLNCTVVCALEEEKGIFHDFLFVRNGAVLV